MILVQYIEDYIDTRNPFTTITIQKPLTDDSKCVEEVTKKIKIDEKFIYNTNKFSRDSLVESLSEVHLSVKKLCFLTFF